MELKELKKDQKLEQYSKLNKKYLQFEKLLEELNTKEISAEVASGINKYIDFLNAQSLSEKKMGEQLVKTQQKILDLVKKELNLVPKNHYQSRWLAIGIGAFGLPLGAVLAASLGNPAYMGMGLPFGVAIGIGVGSVKEKRALEKGNLLDIDHIW